MANTQGLQRFQVGGCVRDALLLRPSHDRDWVVVGATHDEMVERGFVPVGKSFCVYIDPETSEEHALARRDKKVGVGHTGFTVEVENVTLGEDLGRRDFTINAMAIDSGGYVIDPFGGQVDLKKKILRATNPNTFADDPLRVLRAARLAAVLDFLLDKELIDLAYNCANSLELWDLSSERVYREATRAMLEAKTPSAFWRHLRDMGALGTLFPEINAMIGVQHGHEEGDVFTHTMMVLDVLQSRNERTVWAALLHDVGKIVTKREEWPRHHNHEVVGEDIVNDILRDLRAPCHVIDFARVAIRQHMRAHVWRELRAGTVVDMVLAMGSYLRDCFYVFDADSLGRATPRDSGMELFIRRSAFLMAQFHIESLQGRDVLDMASTKCLARGIEMKKPGPWVGEKLHQMRVEAVKRVMAPYREKA